MLKKFFLIVCGSFVGSFLALMVCMFVAFLMSIALMAGMMGTTGAGQKGVPGKHSILHLDLGMNIEERAGITSANVMQMLQGRGTTNVGLNELIDGIKKAAGNKNVEGMYIECNGVSASPATLQQVREAIKDFKRSGKWIMAYGNEGINQGDYYLASVADSIFLNPVGAVDVHGLAGAIPYMKKLLDKVGVTMQIVRVGTFKSAVEPYMLDDMSDANREQTEHYLGSIWKTMVDSMSHDRKLTAAQFNTLADSLTVAMRPEDIVKAKLVDKLCYRSEMEEKLRARTRVGEVDDLKMVTPAEMAEIDDQPSQVNISTLLGGKQPFNTKTFVYSGDHVAVVYAVGEIDGSEQTGNDGIDSEKLSRVIRDLAKADNVKAMVLRVNSPGGSAFGSEQIWKAVTDFKAAGKPVAVSMGDYAASGGYYISCCADRIFAKETTLTGSIGIFGMIPCAEELMENKLGVHIATVKTNENADMGAGMILPGKKLTSVQLASLQNMVNQGYELFTKRCADGRHMPQDSIKRIAEGRVWDGMSAKKIGLVDEFGGLDEAIAWVTKKAGIDKKCDTHNYPELTSDFTSMFSSYMQMSYEEKLQGEMGLLYDWHKTLKQILGRDRILCLSPYCIINI